VPALDKALDNIWYIMGGMTYLESGKIAQSICCPGADCSVCVLRGRLGGKGWKLTVVIIRVDFTDHVEKSLYEGRHLGLERKGV
jgi:hypothetical protein